MRRLWHAQGRYRARICSPGGQPRCDGADVAIDLRPGIRFGFGIKWPRRTRRQFVIGTVAIRWKEGDRKLEAFSRSAVGRTPEAGDFSPRGNVFNKIGFRRAYDLRDLAGRAQT